MPHKQITSDLIHLFLEKSAELYPDKIAIVHETVRASFKDINDKANQLAFWLKCQGIKKGDRVVILLENSLEYVVSYYGVLKSGAVVVPLSTALKPDGLTQLLDEIEPTFIISSFKFERLIQSIAKAYLVNVKLLIQNPKLDWQETKLNMFSWESIIDYDAKRNPQVMIKEEDLSSIIYTSGSSGQPKGVMLSHKNIVSNTRSICLSLGLNKDDIQMVVLPFFYVMGKSLLNTLFCVGGTIVINNKFAFPATVISQMVEEKVTIFSGVPSTFAYLLHRSPFTSAKNLLTNLRIVSQAGGHMAKSIKTILREVLPNRTKIFIMYGATEASARLTCLDPDFFKNKIASIGKAIPGVTIKVLDDGGIEVPKGEKGEIVANGPNIMLGYWKDKESTQKVLDENGYHTGDIGWQDEDGFLFLEGRKDNMLKVGGHKINPQEIEDALLATDLLMEASVFGLKDDLLSNKLVALVVPLIGNCSIEQILKKCSRVLPKYKLPGDVKFIKSLPKNANGKVDKAACIKLYN